ncbi:RNA polymerase sigma factor [Marinitenerispora sediminis]|uniref:RNA polymerase subunit sigma-24 n=1 Tax=Marinitenerispora sediminis TaxID=1931232 RepID=A0A368TEH9_9ACTN|nr:sigma-70 family RNA polymerase sigma factor [Marinitenerispora sediminis]RCV54423.1 RNA polymerase subunit sigma-24 [Marinitenerispora sediminis]RCV61152.1 RNA polymerase subunit sigma-24 [Marinitenerispora sediminis]RCV62427.1 RNA polymerase subunit sigma-24 [Marinitenerispora sediminis]
MTAGPLGDLAGRARDGDRAALAALTRRIQPEVLRRCSRFLPYPRDAEEACRRALDSVARGIADYSGDSLFTTWLYTVVSNSARQTYRSLKSRSAELPAEAERIPQQRDPRTTSVIAGSRVDLLEALDQLERDRPHLVVPLVLRDLCQMEFGEIAAELHLDPGTVRSRIHEGRKHVRRSLAVA